MVVETASQTNHNGIVRNSTLILLAFATAYFSRLLDTIGAPSTINFLHFATVPIVFGVALAKTKTRDRYQIRVTWAILTGLLLLLGVMLVSALVNRAGVVNVIADLMMLGEPFLLLLAVICIPLSPDSLKRLRTWLTYFFLLNLILAFIQAFIILPFFFRYLNTAGLSDRVDLVQGVFFISQGGGVVAASISLLFSIDYFQKAKHVSLWLRIAIILGAFAQIILSDSKQILVAALATWLLLSLSQVKRIALSIAYILGAIVAIAALYWCIQNLDAFSAFRPYLQIAIFDPASREYQIKTAALRLIPTYYESFLNYLFGLGPGHTVGRLGGWMLDKYGDLLKPLGATTHPVSQLVWDELASLSVNNNIGATSTALSPLFGWAGIWGDLGWVGVGAYLYLGYLLWSQLCYDDFSRFLVLNVAIVGFLATQIEEPGYMLFIAILLGLRWQEHYAQRKQDLNINPS